MFELIAIALFQIASFSFAPASSIDAVNSQDPTTQTSLDGDHGVGGWGDGHVANADHGVGGWGDGH